MGLRVRDGLRGDGISAGERGLNLPRVVFGLLHAPVSGRFGSALNRLSVESRVFHQRVDARMQSTREKS